MNYRLTFGADQKIILSVQTKNADTVKPLKTLITFTALSFLGALAAAHELKITEAYARSGGKMAKSGAAFMMIENGSATEDRLIEVKSEAAKKVELHTHIKDEGGVIKMRRVEQGFIIPAQGQHELKRGEDHIMFMGLTSPWSDGDVLDVILRFENAGDVKLSIPVDQHRKGMKHDQ